MIGTAPAPLENLVPVAAMGPLHIVAAEDGRAATREALAHERAAVWVGATGSAEYAEFDGELHRGAPRVPGTEACRTEPRS